MNFSFGFVMLLTFIFLFIAGVNQDYPSRVLNTHFEGFVTPEIDFKIPNKFHIRRNKTNLYIK